MKGKSCTKCNFDYGFIIDYDAQGKEYTFCGNCGTVVKK
jgi:transcription initiation factor TFIIIB Brf1 subunit/transcription initiation factor TFIIB